MRKQTIFILLLATGLAWAEALQGQTNGAQRVADDGSLIPARVLLENPFNPLADLHTDVARLLTDTRYAEFLRLPLVLALILLLLAAEWVLRKYHGKL